MEGAKAGFQRLVDVFALPIAPDVGEVNGGSRLPAPGSWLPAPGSRLLAASPNRGAFMEGVEHLLQKDVAVPWLWLAGWVGGAIWAN